MNRLLIIGSLILAFTIVPAVTGLNSSKALAAAYYVSLAGSNTHPYDTWAKASTSIKPVIDYIRLHGYGSGDTIYIEAGVYTNANDFIQLDNANLNSLTIIGAGRTQTVINPSSDVHTFSIDGNVSDAPTIRGLTLKVGGEKNAVYAIGAAAINNLTFEDVSFGSNAGHISHLIYFGNNVLDYVFRRCEWKSGQIGGFVGYIRGNCSGTFEYCISHSDLSTPGTREWYFNTTGVTNLYHSLFLDSWKRGIITGAGVVNINGSVIAGGFRDLTWGYAVHAAGSGAVNVRNSNLIGGLWDNKIVAGSLATDLNNLIGQDPKFVGNEMRGYIIPRVDDTWNFNYARSVANLLAQYGFKGTYCLETGCWPGGYTPALRKIIEDGVMEVGCHSYSHSELSYSHALTFGYSGAGGNPSMTFDGSTIFLTTSEGIDDLLIDVTAPGSSTITDVIVNYNGVNNWSIAYSSTDGQDPDLLQSARCSSLAPTEATAVPCDLDFDRSGYDAGLFKDEITDPKAWLTTTVNAEGSVIDGQTGQPYVCNSWASPYNVYDTDIRTAVMDAGFLAGTMNTGIASTTLLSKFNIYSLFSYGGGNVVVDEGGPNEEELTRQAARAVAFAAANTGVIIAFFVHNESEVSLEQWGWILDEWKKFGDRIHVTSMQSAAAEITSSGLWINEGWGNYSRTYTRSFEDYRLSEDSPCIDAGDPSLWDGVDNVRDFSGTPVWDIPDIGAFELILIHDADLDTDGDLDNYDLAVFAALYANGDHLADLNNDNAINIEDIIQFSLHYSMECCR